MKKTLQVMIMVLSATAFGGTVNINLANSTLAGGAGSVLTFSGTLVNTTSTVAFLNGANLSGLVAGFSGSTVPFFQNAPLSLAANQTSAMIALFSVTIPSVIATGPYSGTFSIFGGPGANDQALLSSAVFTVQAVPEPGTLGLVLTAAAALAFARRRKNIRILN